MTSQTLRMGSTSSSIKLRPFVSPWSAPMSIAKSAIASPVRRSDDGLTRVRSRAVSLHHHECTAKRARTHTRARHRLASHAERRDYVTGPPITLHYITLPPTPSDATSNSTSVWPLACRGMSWHVMACHGMSCNAMSCNVKPCNVNTMRCSTMQCNNVM